VPRPIHEPSDMLHGLEAAITETSMVDFWRWAFSDLCDDDIKGIFAEWLVAKLLKIPSVRRFSWANSDMIAPNKVRIEVKASSYWQSWKLLDEIGAAWVPPLYPVTPKTQIRFAGLTARNAAGPAKKSAMAELKSHVYVFAFQNETDPEKWNAMDVSQWEFYVLPAERLKELGWGSISLKMLRSQQEPLAAAEFAQVAWKVIEGANVEIIIPDAGTL
jgi:hypothetical protein